jgi:uncharacterized protein YktB (UPF0637 family)
MPEEYEHKRSGAGRRDSDCIAHEGRIDDLDKEVHKQTGFYKTAAIVFTIVAGALSYFATNITAKLTTIEALLTDSKVLMMKHAEQIKVLQGDVKEIQDRHRDLDRSGITIAKPARIK